MQNLLCSCDGRPKRGDELEHFLRMREGGDEAGRTVRDPDTGQDVVLSRGQVEAIRWGGGRRG